MMEQFSDELPNMEDLKEFIEDETPSDVEKIEALTKVLSAVKKADKQSQMEAIARLIADRRDAAVKGKAESGVEARMLEDLAFYNGEDEIASTSAEYTKSRGVSGNLMSNDNRSVDQTKCTEFFNITRPFTDAATARMGDILLPAGDWNFSIKATPVPDLIIYKDSQTPVKDEFGSPVTNPDTGEQAKVGDFINQEIVIADEKAKKAELRIRDQLIETNFHAECRKVIEDAGKLGTGILKGPIPRRVQTLTKNPEGVTQITYKIAPASERVSPFNFFPDPNCGNNISDGSYVFERDYMTARQLKELRDSPGYLAEEIDNILEQGPGKVCLTQEAMAVGRKTSDDDRYEIWYYTGDIKISELAMYDQNVEFNEESDDHFVSATFVLVNDTIIKANVNPFTLAGDLPYDVFPWQRVEGSCWGVGVARHGRVPQKMLLAGARALMDNMALSVAPIIGINRAALIPANNSWALRGGKLFYTREGSDVKAVSDAITAVSIPSHQEEITGIIQLALKMMEDSTGVTFLLQGQQGAAPDTVGGMQLVHQNATAFLRRVARLYDEHITEPHIRRYYANLLKTGEEEEIGDARIEAVGSSALVEREVQLLQLQQMLQMTADPEFQISKKKLAAEMLRLWKYDPSKFMMDSKELEALQSQTPPPDPTIEAARIRTEGELQVAQIKTEAQLEKVRKDTDRDLLYAQGVEQRNEMTHELRIAELQLKRELAILEYANKYNMQLEDIKAKLASDSMKLQVQKELSAINKEMPQVISPPSEPKGRADEGKSFSE